MATNHLGAPAGTVVSDPIRLGKRPLRSTYGCFTITKNTQRGSCPKRRIQGDRCHTEASETTHGPRVNPLRVMVVDDDAMISSLLASLLTEMGYDVCAVENTEAGAVAAAAECAPDLMIVDARLGYGSGVAAVDAILQSRPVAYILISGQRVHASHSDAVTLQKPFREADLARAIARALKAAGHAGEA